MLTSKNVCLAFGSVFVLLGFVPSPIVSSEGFIETNVMPNISGTEGEYSRYPIDGQPALHAERGALCRSLPSN